MGNPFTMMDEYHQRYWQNYYRVMDSPGGKRMSDEERHWATHVRTKREEKERAAAVSGVRQVKN